MPLNGHPQHHTTLRSRCHQTRDHLHATPATSTGTSFHPPWDGCLVHQALSTISPFPERCRHVTVGSGLPKARHMRVTLLPSFTVMSDEMFTIWGGTAKHKEEQSHHQHMCSLSPIGTPPVCHWEHPVMVIGFHPVALTPFLPDGISDRSPARPQAGAGHAGPPARPRPR